MMIIWKYYQASKPHPAASEPELSLKGEDLDEFKKSCHLRESIKTKIRTRKRLSPPNIQIDKASLIKLEEQFNTKEDFITHVYSLSSPSYCFKCQKPKKVRAHHCRICNLCIERMDHHCFFTDSCIGASNQRFFIQFLFFVTFSLLFINASMAIEFFVNGKRFEADVSGIENTLIIFCSATCFAISLFTGFLFGFNLYLMRKNLTTVEFNVDEIVKLKPFEGESAVEEVFGKDVSVIGMVFL